MSTNTSRQALLKAWNAYKDYRRSHVAASTFYKDYEQISDRLALMPMWIASGQDWLHWMETQKQKDGEKRRWSPETVRRTLQQMKAATRWAAKAGLLKGDPFQHIDNIKKRNRRGNQYRAFSVSGRAAILAAAEELTPRSRRWVQGLFYTGCRPSELRALKRHHWAKDGSQLQIVTAFPVRSAAPQGTKTGNSTPDYPCNSQLQRLLSEATAGASPEDWIFRGEHGGPFDYQNFQADIFKPMVERLAEAGKVAFVLSQYHARHTWITEALKVLSVQDVAYLARTSPDVIYKHYAQVSNDLKIPEI